MKKVTLLLLLILPVFIFTLRAQEDITPLEQVVLDNLNFESVDAEVRDQLDPNCFSADQREEYISTLSVHAFGLVKERFIARLLTDKSGFDYPAYVHQLTQESVTELRNMSCPQLFDLVAHEKNPKPHDHGGAIPKAAGDPCTNPDFEQCDFTNWVLERGTVPGTAPYSLTGITPSPGYSTVSSGGTSLPGNNQHAIVTGGTDVNGGFPMVYPGGSCSALLGDFEEAGYNAAILTQTFQVSATDAVLLLNYAVVLEDPGHTVNQQPYFRVRVYDQAGNSLSCGSYEAYAGDGQPGWSNGGGMRYLPWTTVMIPLAAYIGTNVTVQFTVGDCALGGHSGYAFVDASCQSMALQITGTEDCDFPINLIAPAGAASYLWDSGQTTQTITINAPGTYGVNVIPYQGMACANYIDTVVFAFNPPTADAGPDFTICEGDVVQLQGSGNGTTQSWDNPASLDNPNSYTPNASPTTTTTYTLLVDNLDGCTDTDQATVTVVPYADATINPQGNVCDIDPAFNLSSVQAGGTWSGTGITDATNGTFDPGVAGPGTHTITYSIPGMCPDTQTSQITVEQYLAPTISPAGPFCDDDAPFNLTAANPGGTWSGTGITDATNGTFDPTVAGAGTHTITYTIAGLCGDSDTETITVNPRADATINPQASLCDNSPAVTLTAIQAGGTWSGNGITDAANGTFDPAVAGAGTHTITYSIGGPCPDSKTISILVEPYADPTITPAGPFCETDAAVNLQAVDPTGVWAGPGITDAVNGTFDPAVAGPGTHTVTYTTPGGCGSSDSETIIVGATVDASITPVPNQCHNGAPVQLTGADPNGVWSGTGITDATNGIFDPTVAGPGTYTITYTITDICSDSQTTNIVVYTPMATWITPDTTICEYGTATVSSGASGGSGNYSYSWDNGMGNNAQFTDGPGAPITYTVTIQDDCETQTQSTDIFIEYVPQIDFVADTLIGCVPFDVTFTNLSGAGSSDCVWDFGNGDYLNDCTTASTTYTAPGCYDVDLQLVTPLGCTDHMTMPDYICVGPDPVADFSADKTEMMSIDTEVEFTNESSGATSYVWDFGDNSVTSNVVNPTHLYPESHSTNYTVELVAINDFGCRDTAYLNIRIKEELIFYVPNTFTPDNDEYNQQWLPIFHSGYDIQSYELYIFNRWGEIVWESHDASVGWDGTYNGRIVKEGVYTWKIIFREIDTDKRHEYAGHLNLLR